MKKLLAVLILILLLSSQPLLHAGAANTSRDIFAIEDYVYSDISQNQSGNGWYWDAANFTLTLDGYNGGPVIFIPSSQNSNTFNIVVKNNNVVRYDTVPTTYPLNEKSYFAALLVENCNVHISGGGTLSTSASGKYSTYSFSATKNITIENITLNCFGEHQSFACENIVVKNSVLNIDAPEGYWCLTSLYENTSINFKNTNPNGSKAENFASGGKQIFKNCTVDVLVGARPLDSTPIQSTLFAGLATYEFDNTVFRVKHGQHNHADNSIALFSLGYPENMGNGITIKNNSRFEFDDCVDYVFCAFEINVLNSSIKGTCTNNLFSSILLNITDSNLDVACTGNTQYVNTLIVGQDINISNSNIKGQINGNIWKTCNFLYPEYERNLSLVDTHLDIAGKVDKFVDSLSLNYTTPEKWTVILDGVESDLSVNSPQLNLRHEKIVITHAENKNSQQANNTTSDVTKKPTESDSVTTSEEHVNQSVSEEPEDQSVSEETTNNDTKETVESDTTPKEADKNNKIQKEEKNNASKFTFIIILVPAIGIVGATIFIYIKRKIKK